MTTTRSKRGTARLIERAGKFRVRFPKALFDGKDKQLCLELAAIAKNRTIAEGILQAINADIALGQCDLTLERYQPQHKRAGHQAALQKLEPQMNLLELWQAYSHFKATRVKQSTLRYYLTTIEPHIAKCPYQRVKDALKVSEWLIETSSLSMVKRVLGQISSACDWGIEHQIIMLEANPYKNLAKEFKHGYELGESKAIAFTPSEQEQIIYAFKSHHNLNGGFNYQLYAPFVEFLFLTGCRPSEAIGLTWQQIEDSWILFDRSITWSQGKKIASKGSKTNRVRRFPLTLNIEKLLKRLPREENTKEELVFKSPQNKVMDYKNFSNRAWNKVVNPIKLDTTPYSCRDTFITNQLREGKPIALIAKWCDTSTQMIEKYYLDDQSMIDIKPA